jgi:hypothetical protein
LTLERLEDRTLLSATLVLDGPQNLVGLPNVAASSDPATSESEMTVAINHTNPLNVAGFTHNVNNLSQIQVFYSMDGGSTWTRTQITGSGSVNNDNQGSGSGVIRFDPTIKFDDGGTLFIGYGAYSSGTTNLMVGRSTDGGATFANDTFAIVDTQSGYGGVDKFYLGIGPDGPGSANEALYVSWERNAGSSQPIMVAGSNDGGVTFTTPTMIDTYGNGSFWAGPAVGPNGELYVVWQSTTEGKVKSRVKPDGLWGSGDWNPTVTVRNLQKGLAGFSIPPQSRRGIYNGPSIDVDRSGGAHNGRAYVGWVDQVSGTNTDIYLAYSDDDGATWTSPGSTGNVEDVPTASAFHPWVSVDQSSGALTVQYRTNDDGDSDNHTSVTRVASSFDGGDTFPSKVNLADRESRALSAGNSNEFGDYSGLDVHDGTVLGFWSDNRGATEGTYTTKLYAYSGRAYFQSTTSNNTLYVTGDDNGPTDDTIIVRHSPVNADFMEVLVNGQTQYAGLALTVNNLVVNGGDGNNTIVVQGSFPGLNTTLTAGKGRSLFITGMTPATIQGGGGDNILIGGSTVYDADTTALAAIMAEWTRTDATYADRVDHLLNGGGLNGSYLLNTSTVTGNGGGNTLLGGTGLNLYFGNPDLDTNDWDPSTETFVTV